jgi:hypothetical protein
MSVRTRVPHSKHTEPQAARSSKDITHKMQKESKENSPHEKLKQFCTFN